ncbi:pimeloyl-ACP methyl ester carboxylesterase [Hamadaea flava]|uniref:Alpha/beta fold hydrolase n=1 Tax=Hamadaea flava TaxID=1742688 RepID=A0ABV8LU27_9ACTN|nr:alpha/beta fold hydrolase [Hamadaea flava]MCP2327617.1 pimeloyl-ACP methyl ester carboxylesterase [Hamadaea flava]
MHLLRIALTAVLLSTTTATTGTSAAAAITTAATPTIAAAATTTATGTTTAAIKATTAATTTSAGVTQATAETGLTETGLNWTTCGPKTDQTAQCATLRVPLDWSRPSGRKITLAVARHPATDQARKIGTLFFRPGAGVLAVNQVATPSHGGLGLLPELAERFDLVGIDSRGGGLDLSYGTADANVHSASLGCDRAFNDPAVSRFPADPAGYAELRRHNQAAAASCDQDLIRHLDAETQARDAEAFRVALGEPQLTWFAWTYASLIAQTYAQLFPGRIRALVLDSPLDHTVPTATYVRTQVRETEAAFNRFVAWCGSDPSCALYGQDIPAIYDEVVERANREPLPVAGLDHAMTGEEIGYIAMYVLENGTVPAGYGGWSDLAAALGALRTGDTTGWAGAYAGTLAPPYYHPYRASGCVDFPRDITGYAEFQALRREIRRLAPHTGGVSDSWDYVSGCQGWPVPSVAPRRPVIVHNAPPTLLVVTRHNPLAPYDLAIRVAGQIEGSSTLTYEGDAHIAFFNSHCVRDAELAFLTTATPGVAACADGA